MAIKNGNIENHLFVDGFPYFPLKPRFKADFQLPYTFDYQRTQGGYNPATNHLPSPTAHLHLSSQVWQWCHGFLQVQRFGAGLQSCVGHMKHVSHTPLMSYFIGIQPSSRGDFYCRCFMVSFWGYD